MEVQVGGNAAVSAEVGEVDAQRVSLRYDGASSGLSRGRAAFRCSRGMYMESAPRCKAIASAYRVNVEDWGSNATNSKETIFNVPIFVDIFLQSENSHSKTISFKN